MNTTKNTLALLIAGGLLSACAGNSDNEKMDQQATSPGGSPPVATITLPVQKVANGTSELEEASAATAADQNSLVDVIESPVLAAEPAAQGRSQPRVQVARMTAQASMIAPAPVTDWAASPPPVVDRENYLTEEPNGVKQVQLEPVSTFSIDVDTAAYANIRRMLAREGRLPPEAAVKIEEMLNYFDYHYPVPPTAEQPFSVQTEIAPAPWSAQRQLLRIGIKGFEPADQKRPPANLVFLIDVSGSMQSPDKLPLVKQSLRMLLQKLGADDRVAIAVYAGAAGTVLESTPGSEKVKIQSAIDNLQAGGSTHGSAGIHLAYQIAQENLIEGGINRVIIASDGDMNVGTVNMDALKDLIERKREGGVALTTLGFGSGNYNYALMEQLADVGNGNAAYIDSLREAQKVLVNEMQSNLQTIASDVKIQVEFNPAVVSEYRLIGYENRILNREDFRNDKVDAGDIGAGHTVTALYELTLAGSAAERIPALRYGNSAGDKKDDSKNQNVTGSDASELGFIKIRYKQPGAKESVEISQAVLSDSVLPSLASSSDDFRFAASVAGFGQLLQGGKFTGQWNYGDALDLARQSRADDLHGYRSEFLHLIELAQTLSSSPDA